MRSEGAGARFPDPNEKEKRRDPNGAACSERCGELAGARTQDPRLKRALLYQLSYELTSVAKYS